MKQIFISPIHIKKHMKDFDKNLSGKSDEREVKICKNGSFTLYPSFFIFPSLRFLTPIPYLWASQRICLVALNISFSTTKRYLWRGETLPLANSDYVNREITDKNLCNNLSINALQKSTKSGLLFDQKYFCSERRP